MTTVGIITECLEKIKAKAHLRSVIEVNPDALAIAAEKDAAADKSGPLYGVPVLVKDNVDTVGMCTAAGSVALAANMTTQDAPVVRNLREAGAVIVGKANTTEFANYMCNHLTGERMPNGYSSRGGQTMHPTHEGADPSGSSAGSAVAVAAGLVSMAVGSETCGSIISPAQHCGIVGIKPTDGLVSKDGVIPISFTLDTLGPMARSVKDAALLLGAMAGQQYKMAAKPADITVGVCRVVADSVNKEWLAANEGLLVVMEQLGMHLVELPTGDLYDTSSTIFDTIVFPIMHHEFKHGINGYLAAQNNPEIPQTLTEIIAYNEANADVALKYGQGRLVDSNKIGDSWQTQPEYTQAMAKRRALQAGMAKLFDDNGIDVMMSLAANFTVAATVGFPSITLPIGTTAEGLPIGCCLIARPFAEDVLLSAATAVEASMTTK